MWASAPDWPTARLHRDRITAATRMCLLEYPDLHPQGPVNAGYRLVIPTGRVQFGGLTRMTNKSVTWGGALIVFELEVQETLRAGSIRPPVGSSDILTATAEAVGFD